MTLRANKSILLVAGAAIAVSALPSAHANPAMVVHSPAQSMTPAYSFAAPNHFAPASSPGPIFGPTDPGIPVDSSHAAVTAGVAAGGGSAAASTALTTVGNSLAPIHTPDGSNLTVVNNNTLFAPNGSFSAHSHNLSRMRAVSAIQISHPTVRVLPVSQIVAVDKGSGLVTPGNYLVRPNENVSLTTGFGVVNVAAQSCVLIAVTPASVNIYDLYDRHAGSVSWSQGAHRLKLLPGWVATISNDNKLSPGQINPCCSIYSHSMQTQTLPNGEQISSGKFSIVSALVQLAPLRHDELLIKAAAIQAMTAH